MEVELSNLGHDFFIFFYFVILSKEPRKTLSVHSFDHVRICALSAVGRVEHDIIVITHCPPA